MEKKDSRKNSGKNVESRRNGRNAESGRDSRNRRNRQDSKCKAGRVCSIIGILMIVAVIILCSLLVLPEMIGFHMYHVISGSMEPTIKVGSLLYVREENVEEIKEEDIIAFYSSVEEGSIITHRVVKNNIVSGAFRTKGDANDTEDPTPVPYENFIGKVVLTIPYIGQLLTVMTSFYGKIAAACIVLMGVVLNLIGGRLKE
ncbi:MAG: signal peptidase I [Dorea sp.]|jgi:signal peptidase|nr:signal peptidase I [Dorea sp.]